MLMKYQDGRFYPDLYMRETIILEVLMVISSVT